MISTPINIAKNNIHMIGQSHLRPKERKDMETMLILVAFPKTAHRIAVFVIPFGPAGRESADLIAADADIPRLGN